MIKSIQHLQLARINKPIGIFLFTLAHLLGIMASKQTNPKHQTHLDIHTRRDSNALSWLYY